MNEEMDPDQKETKDKEIEMKFKAKIDAVIKHKALYELNKTKAYSLIWGRCSMAMKGQLEQRTDYNSKIYNDPVNLIQAIKEQTLNF